MRVMDKNRPSAGSGPAGPGRDAAGEGAQTFAAAEEGRPALREMAGEFLEGRILIAMPNIGDPRFERAVLLICAHDDQQAMAITLNRPLEGMSVPGLLQRLGMGGETVPDAPVMFGGPVERERGYVLHTEDYAAAQATEPVTSGVAMTDTREVLEALGDDSRRPRRFILALGYAGWGAGQLENEIRQGVWLTCDADEELVFGLDHAGKWSAALAKIGVSPERLSPQSGRA